MDFLRREVEIDSVVPGVTAAYRKLTDSRSQGIYTSLGRYYNHTIFGRDAGMTAKFVSYFDHNIAWQTILTLAQYQGKVHDPRTGEQPGRLHHEMRDYAAWTSRWYDRIGLELAGLAWGKQDRKLVSYYAADTTATYVRLVHKYAGSIDRSIIDRTVPQRDGSSLTLGESVANAAQWLVDQVDERGIFWVNRTNRWSLPYQTFADSVSAYAWSDGAACDVSRRHSFIEVQVYALDALQDACELLPRHPNRETWQLAAKKMQHAILDDFCNDDSQSFTPGLFSRGSKIAKLDNDMIMAAWTLNASFWDDIPDEKRISLLKAIISRVFQTDFMTDYGIRTKSVRTKEPLGEVIDYHGSQTIWPMFNFMVIEGLRRHGLYRLARQIEFRLLNTINALGDFPEFFIVDHAGVLYKPSRHAKLHKPGQMIPEQNIAFTVVPALTLAYRHVYPRHNPATDGWQHDFETTLLEQIPNIDLLTPDKALADIESTPLKIRRTSAGLRSVWHIAPVILKKPS